jgi:lyso-ornithine lipid O-acyltransferase
MLPSRLQVRGAVRLAIMVGSMLEALVRFGPIYLRSRGRVSGARRAAWVHESFARLARRLSLVPIVRIAAAGEDTGLLVSNHLSYLDIMVYAAARPLRFVAKSEIRRWPLVGILASLGGTIFVERERSLQVGQAARQIEQSLREGVPVLLFPEGTSSDGSSVLPFLPPLFEPAIRAGACVTAAAIRYYADDVREDEVTYWGEMVFLPHAFRTLCLEGLTAEITFGSSRRYDSRKIAAQVAWRQVQALREAADHLCASPFTGSPVVVVDMHSCLPLPKSICT